MGYHRMQIIRDRGRSFLVYCECGWQHPTPLEWELCNDAWMAHHGWENVGHGA